MLLLHDHSLFLPRLRSHCQGFALEECSLDQWQAPDTDPDRLLLLLDTLPPVEASTDLEKWLVDFVRLDRPVLALGHGAILLARALGARVQRMDRPWYGLSKLLAWQAAHPLCTRPQGDFPAGLFVAYRLGSLPQGASLLAADKERTICGYALGTRSLGLVFQPLSNLSLQGDVVLNAWLKST